MASLQQIQSRRKAVKNVGQITKAMEVVAATKMRKSQDTALRSRPYAFKALELLDRMLQFAPLESDLVASREVAKTLVVIMTSDRGLIGSFNTQSFRFADGFFAEDSANQKPEHSYLVVAVGKKAYQYATKKGLNIVEKFEGFGEHILPSEIDPLTNFIIDGFKEEKWDRVVTISTHFRSTLKQEVLKREVLPVDINNIRETVENIVPEKGRWAEAKVDVLKMDDEEDEKDMYIFEPGAKEVLEALIPHLVRMQVYDLVLEANASEHSARRVAMKTASDNAVELSETLSLEYNKVRQAAITKEIIEITSTQNALQ